MTEVATGFFPDLYTRWGMTLAGTQYGETMFTEAGRRQSMNFGQKELRTFTAQFIDEPPNGLGLTYNQVRAVIADFKKTRSGAHGQSFNFWSMIARKDYPGVDAGVAGAVLSVAGATSVILPWRITNPSGGVIGQIYDVRVAGVSQVFTVRHLLPAPRSFASLRFDGATGYVTCGSQASLRSTGDVTWAARVWRASDSVIMIMSNENTSASGTAMWLNNGLINIRTNQAAATVTRTSAAAVPLMTWTDIAVVKSGTNVTFYINGFAAGTATGLTNPVAATLPFLIGAKNGTGFFDGMIANVRYYNSALSASEVALLVTDAPTPTPNLKGWWRLNEGYGTAVADISGSTGNNGTVTGTAPWVAGHEEIVFSGGAQTGAVTIAIYGRELMVCGFGSEPMTQSFIASGGDVRAVFNLVIQERY